MSRARKLRHRYTLAQLEEMYLRLQRQLHTVEDQICEQLASHTKELLHEYEGSDATTQDARTSSNFSALSSVGTNVAFSILTTDATTMTEKEYFEIRVYTSSGNATADIVRVRKDEALSVVGKITTTSASPVSVLRLQPLGEQPPRFPRLKKLKPKILKVNLGLISAEW